MLEAVADRYGSVSLEDRNNKSQSHYWKDLTSKIGVQLV